MTDPDTIIDVVLALDTLSRLPRTGWLLRGVQPAESIADHSFATALLAMLLTDAIRAAGTLVDGERVLRMALLHDAPESRTGDIPMPVKTDELAAAIDAVEEMTARSLLPEECVAMWREAAERVTLEARVVAAADKIQMLSKAFAYETHGHANLDDFWNNPTNFNDWGLPVVRSVLEALCKRAGRPVPATYESKLFVGELLGIGRSQRTDDHSEDGQGEGGDLEVDDGL